MIVIPMAGLSSRFKKAGYKLPKYMLEAHGKTLFTHSVDSFKRYFHSEKFLFIALDVFNTTEFIETECEKLNITNYEIVTLLEPTRGQAETVYLGLKSAEVLDDEYILIFNIDTFRPNFKWPQVFEVEKVDGYLETFVGSGKNWSNVEPKSLDNYSVKRTAEKKEISEFCCTGLYFFRRTDDFIGLFEEYSKNDLENIDAGEFYIAPMYNEMIREGKDIRFSIVDTDEVIFCGVPSEYENFLKVE